MKNRLFVTAGLALFAMYFGAGNLIFPTMIGFKTQGVWYMGALGFLLSGIGLPMFTLFALNKVGGSISTFFGKLSPRIALTISSIIILIIAPLFAIPRIGTIVYELSIESLFEGVNEIAVLIGFFVMVALVALKSSKVVDYIGNIMTPILFIILLFIIIKSILFPLSNPTVEVMTKAEGFKLGFTSGYQTMDAFASLIFGTLILRYLSKRISDEKKQKRQLYKSAIVAGLGLFIVYIGLVLIASKAGDFYVANGGDMSSLNEAGAIKYLVIQNLGFVGSVLLSICIFFACFSSAIALINMTASYFKPIFNDKIEYKYLVVIFVGISFLISTVGLSGIIKLAVPFLILLYPFLIALVVTFLVLKKPEKIILKSISILTIISTIPEVLNFFGIDLIYLIDWLPLYSYGLYWVIPSLVGFIIGFIIRKIKKNEIID